MPGEEELESAEQKVTQAKQGLERIVQHKQEASNKVATAQGTVKTLEDTLQENLKHSMEVLQDNLQNLKNALAESQQAAHDIQRKQASR